MGIVMVRETADLQVLRRQAVGRPAQDVLVQEGVLTNERIMEAPAEPVVYMIDRYVVGGFYRANAGLGTDENLNVPGTSFLPLAFEQSRPRAQTASRGASAPNRFYMYGVVARLAMLAASYELEATNPDAEVYE
jgi:glutamate--cysteine ligase